MKGRSSGKCGEVRLVLGWGLGVRGEVFWLLVAGSGVETEANAWYIGSNFGSDGGDAKGTAVVMERESKLGLKGRSPGKLNS